MGDQATLRVSNGKLPFCRYGVHRPVLADSVEKVVAFPCRWQNYSISERGGEQHDWTVTGRTAAPVLLV